MNDEISIQLQEGKYHYLFQNGKQTITRHGEFWRDETGDNLLLAMAQTIEDYRELLAHALKDAKDLSHQLDVAHMVLDENT